MIFHLRIVIDDDHVGFYIHYKHHTIPKYSFAFESVTPSATPNVGGGGTNEPAGPQEITTKLCQSTANSIPAKSSRCGHRAVISISDILSKMSASTSKDDTPVSARRSNRSGEVKNASTLNVYFCFDEDNIEDQSTGTYIWHIRHLSKIHSKELYSSIIVTNFGVNAASVFFMISLDHRIDFRVAHKDNIPQFGFAFINTRQEIIFRSSTSVEPPLREIILRNIAHDDTLLVRVIFFINPLHQISANPTAGFGGAQGLSGLPSLSPQHSVRSAAASVATVRRDAQHLGGGGGSARRHYERRRSSEGVQDEAAATSSTTSNTNDTRSRSAAAATAGGPRAEEYASALMPSNIIDASECHVRGVPDFEPLENQPTIPQGDDARRGNPRNTPDSPMFWAAFPNQMHLRQDNE